MMIKRCGGLPSGDRENLPSGIKNAMCIFAFRGEFGCLLPWF